MRQIVLDTETTGLEVSQNHRIIEIGGIELVNRKATGNNYHQYLQPDREIDEGAQQVHGISNEDLIDKPRFSDVADDLLNYLGDAELIIHNAVFDVEFIDAELKRLGGGYPLVRERCKVLDTLQLARQMHPGQRNNLDALCGRYDVDNSQRDLHGALLDARILADVYLAMTGGQTSLILADSREQAQGNSEVRRLTADRPPLPVVQATEEELRLHRQRLEEIASQAEGGCVWLDAEDDSRLAVAGPQ